MTTLYSAHSFCIQGFLFLSANQEVPAMSTYYMIRRSRIAFCILVQWSIHWENFLACHIFPHGTVIISLRRHAFMSHIVVSYIISSLRRYSCGISLYSSVIIWLRIYSNLLYFAAPCNQWSFHWEDFLACRLFLRHTMIFWL